VIAIDLTGKTALVTGGGRGLGREVSLLLGRAGADVIVNYVRHRDPAEETVDLLHRAGRQAAAVQADVSHTIDVTRLIGTAEERFGGVHILVSNAALGVFRELPELDERGVRRTFEISAWSLLNVAARLFPFFRSAAYGRIIAISSLGAHRVAPGYAGMAMAKGALEAVTRYLAAYVGEMGDVTANAIVPSAFDESAERLPYAPLRRQLSERAARTPGIRFPTMEEVARTVLFLASDLGAGVNGQAITVDRGLSLT
jgi:enoyl-[acyl-carrier protein] reductase III